MDGNSQYPLDKATLNGEYSVSEQVSTTQLRRLVRLLDGSDISEIEVKRAASGLRLVLRKAKATEASGSENELYHVAVRGPEEGSSNELAVIDTKHTITAPLVGIFHSWGKPRGAALVHIGDRVKIAQLVGTIQSLNVINEIESPVAGRVVEILVQDSQPVEYGQPLITIDSMEEE